MAEPGTEGKTPREGKRGRPAKLELTPDIQQRLIQAILSGNYLETAAAYAGIARSTLYSWLRRCARENNGPFHELSNAVKKALADAEVRDVTHIAKAGESEWQASAWRLERKFPDKWGRRDPRGYSAEQFTAFVNRLAGFVRDHLPPDQRMLFNRELDGWLRDLEERRVGRRAG